MRYRVLSALLVLLACLAIARPEAASAEPNVLGSGLPRSGGIGLAVWGGGATAGIPASASAQGCVAQAVWVTASGGQLVGYVFGAPAIVSAAFVALYPTSVPANTPLLVVCQRQETAAEAFNRDISRLMFDGFNRERTIRGLAPFAESATLVAAASKYSVLHLATGLPLSHELGGTQVWDRARAEGYASGNVSEVLVGQSQTRVITAAEFGPAFVKRLMDSPPHREILLSTGQTEIGVGCALGKDSDGLNFAICTGVTGKP